MAQRGKPRTISIGGATFDLFVRTGRDLQCMQQGQCALFFPLGDKIRVREIIETCGGGAANTAIGLQRLGCSASFAGVVGNDQWGGRILNNLRNEHVDTRAATVIEGETSGFSVILSAESGERVILYHPGTNAHLHDVTFDRAAAAGADWIYLNRLSEQGCNIEDDLIAILATHANIGLTWNPGGCQLDTGIEDARNRALLTHTDLLLLNREEALRFAKATDVDGALALLAKAGLRFVCITDGKAGVTATDGTSRCHCPVADPQAVVIDTTGAGDAFGVGATWALITGEDLPQVLRAGTLNAASVIGSMGAQAGLLTQSTMQRKLKETARPVQP